jgi:cysteine desulfurase
MDLVYLDNNATTQPADQVVRAIHHAQSELWANPSSVHRFGQLARQKIELARASLATLLATHPRQIVFTSGGTESNNLAIHTILNNTSPAPGTPVSHNTPGTPGALITSRIEHSAIREPAEAFGKTGNTVWLPVGAGGLIDPQTVTDAILANANADVNPVGPILISIQWANNETGTIQPIHAIADAIQAARDKIASQKPTRPRVFFHVDACQAVGKIPVNLDNTPIDLLTLSAHKFHGPKGVGALYIRRNLRIQRHILGGPQELNRRGGTENSAGIIGLGVAADLAKAFLDDHDQLARLTAMRDKFEADLLKAVPTARINSPSQPSQRLWNTTNIAFPTLEAEAVLMGLSEKGICASAGAACSSGSLDPSPVLLAMGVPESAAHGSIRLSLGRSTTQQQLDYALKIIPDVVARLGLVMPAP